SIPVTAHTPTRCGEPALLSCGSPPRSSLWSAAPWSVLREVVGALVAARLEPADLHQDVVQQRRRADPEPVGAHPLLAESLVQHDEVADGVLGGADAAGGLHAHLDAGGGSEVADRLEHDEKHGEC